jgi:crossover junction endodeoxyribonuclease RusA
VSRKRDTLALEALVARRPGAPRTARNYLARTAKPQPTAAIRLTLPYPPSVNRIYRAINGRQILSRVGRAYKARVEYLRWENRYVPFDGQVRVTLGVYRPAKRGDLDNTMKATLDALKGVAFRDDKQVCHINAERFEDKANPRVEVMVELYAAAALAGGTQR